MFRPWFSGIVFIIIATLGGLSFQLLTQSHGFFFGLEESARDALVRRLVSDQTDPQVVVIDIDETSIQRVGAWPWSRSTIADLLELLVSDYGVRSVGLDVVFPEAGDLVGDSRLQALGQVAPITFAHVFDFYERDQAISIGHLVRATSTHPDVSATLATGYIANHVGLKDVVCVGNIGVLPDIDGVVRHIPLRTRFQDDVFLLLPLAMLQCDGHYPIDLLSNPQSSDWRIPYDKALGAFQVVPAMDVLTQTLPKDFLLNKWVLIGSSALGINDRVATPLSPSVPGVMVHASVLSSYLNGAHSLQSSIPSRFSVVYALLCLCLFVWLFKKKYTLQAVLSAIIGACIWLVLSVYFVSIQANFSILSVYISYLIFFACFLPYEWMGIRRHAVHLLKIFSVYVAPDVVKELRQKNFNPLALVERDITVLVADMQGFTRLSHDLGLTQTGNLVKQFLEVVTPIILNYGGTLDKYTGDGLMAFWGAPIPNQNHADRALDAAIDMTVALSAWNARLAKHGFSPIRVRFGIQTGKALVGDLGTDFRRSYTALGDCINMASKLEGYAKYLDCDIVIGMDAAKRISTHELESLGEKHIVDALDPIEIFRLKSNPRTF